jgi:hypothetical protein
VRRRRWELISESLVEWAIRLCGVSAIIFVFGIFYFVFREGVGLLWSGRFNVVQFLTSIEWYPTSQSHVRYGALALIAGTFSVTLLAMAIAVPFGLGAAIYVSEFCSPRAKESLKIVIELLAAIPSVVWGFIGLTVMNSLIIELFNTPIGLNALNGGIILALMSAPIIVFGLRLHNERPALRKSDLDAAVESSLTEGGLWKDLKDRLKVNATTLQLEQQQKLCIARLLPLKPEVVLMDEPCSALDVDGTRAIEDLMSRLKGRYTILIVTHNMAQARRASDEYVFMLLGEVIEHRPTEDLFSNPHDPKTVEYIEGRFG